MVCKIARFGYNGASLNTDPSAAFCTSLSYSLLPVLAIRIITHPLRPKYRISIAKTQTCLQVPSLFSAYNTIDTTQCNECAHNQ